MGLPAAPELVLWLTPDAIKAFYPQFHPEIVFEGFLLRGGHESNESSLVVVWVKNSKRNHGRNCQSSMCCSGFLLQPPRLGFTDWFV